MSDQEMGVSEHGYSVEVPEGYDEAVLRARLALKAEGFSIITESHVGGLFGPEAGPERQYLFMGGWQSIDNRSVDENLDVAVHLPCNVVVQEQEGAAIVAAFDPAEGFEDAALPPGVAEDAREALTRVLVKVAEPDR
ncbi:MAG: DUF302 domain-containing protein [Actinobacteria bacterium]|nr:DUF302 domain-containing protein [Actinomycetota bacterium]